MAAKMLHRQVKIINKRGLHARAAAKFVKLAAEFKSDIKVVHGDLTVTGRSIMGLLMLGAGIGSEISLAVSGADAKAALESLVKLVEDGFGEM